MTTALHIKATDATATPVEITDFTDLQDAVGGMIEAVGGMIEGHDFTLYIHGEGKIFGDPLNLVASSLVVDRLMPGDYIAGDAVMIGGPDAEGRDTDLPTVLLDGLTMALNA